MMIILNPNAGGGTAMKKWARIEQKVLSSVPDCILYVMNEEILIDRLIYEGLAHGETDFVAAGGDGTVNTILNVLMRETAREPQSQARLGAIGLGSSNDFHKPFNENQMYDQISVKIDTEKTTLRDIGCLTIEQNGSCEHHYFLLNASVGVTAEANWFFNHSKGIQRALKRLHTQSAIVYAAFATILRYSNISISLRSGQGRLHNLTLSNLNILKTPHVSGSIRYDSDVRINDGRFDIRMFSDMSKRELAARFIQLTNGSPMDTSKTYSWSDNSLQLSAASPFAVEFDGEVVKTRTAKFSTLPRYIQVCQ